MRVSVVIMAHPKRQHFIPYLLGELGDVPVIWDRFNDRWDTGKRAMAAFDDEADWHIVIQDDAILCRDFLAGAKNALRDVPEGPVSFYTGRYSPHRDEIEAAVRQASAVGAHYLVMKGPHWGVGIAIPTSLIPEMLFGAELLRNVPNYDMRIQRWFSSKGYRCRYTIPSLVNHRVGDENPSLVAGRGNSKGRIAHQWIGNRSALEINWSGGQVFEITAGKPPTYRRRNGQMGKQRIADRRIYGRDSKGRAVLVAAPGQPIPDGYVPDESASPVNREKVISSQKLDGLTYPELQKLVKARGVRPVGRKKADLIRALS